MTPKDEAVFDEKVSSKVTLPSHTLGFCKHEFGSDGKIKDTWFLRQFSKDEAARKVGVPGLHLPSATLPVVVTSESGVYACCKTFLTVQHSSITRVAQSGCFLLMSRSLQLAET